LFYGKENLIRECKNNIYLVKFYKNKGLSHIILVKIVSKKYVIPPQISIYIAFYLIIRIKYE